MILIRSTRTPFWLHTLIHMSVHICIWHAFVWVHAVEFSKVSNCSTLNTYWIINCMNQCAALRDAFTFSSVNQWILNVAGFMNLNSQLTAVSPLITSLSNRCLVRYELPFEIVTIEPWDHWNSCEKWKSSVSGRVWRPMMIRNCIFNVAMMIQNNVSTNRTWIIESNRMAE